MQLLENLKLTGGLHYISTRQCCSKACRIYIPLLSTMEITYGGYFSKKSLKYAVINKFLHKAYNVTFSVFLHSKILVL